MILSVSSASSVLSVPSALGSFPVHFPWPDNVARQNHIADAPAPNALTWSSIVGGMKTAEDLIAVFHQEPTVFQIKPVFPDVPNQSEVLLIIAVAPLFSGTETSTVVGEDTFLLVHLLVYVESDPDGVAKGCGEGSFRGPE
jgi:hypothetical protein